jgi:threonine aldolase
MANLISVLCMASPGEEVIVDRQCHVFNYEAAGVATIGGVQMYPLDGEEGVLTAELVEPHIRIANLHTPGTSVIAMENTHNRAGGHVYPFDEMRRVRELADKHGVRVHVDGARIWNAHVATGISLRDYGSVGDTISMCFSKGLGAPVGSALASSRELVDRARRRRKQLGGGMRQAGILAAAANYALDNHVERLAEDHINARRLGELVAGTAGLTMIHTVETNIVIFAVDSAAFSVKELLEQLKGRGVLAVPFGAGCARMVTHLDVSSEDIERAGEVLASLERN